MARNTRTFSDLDFNFLVHPRTKDVSTRYDEDAIKQSLRNLILTRNYERPFRSYLGSQVNALLFEPISPLLTSMLEKAISDVIQNFEPRVDLLNVVVQYSPQNNDVYVTISFKIRNTQTPMSVNLILERTR
jgi:phage baseplate assembly protein W